MTSWGDSERELRSFIEQSRSVGKTDDEIRDTLLENGWKADNVEFGLCGTSIAESGVPSQISTSLPATLKATGIALGITLLLCGAVFVVWNISNSNTISNGAEQSAPETSAMPASRSRLVTQEDIIGKWEVVYRHRSSVRSGGVPDTGLSYQWFSFLPNGYVKELQSTMPFDQLTSVILEKGPETSTYRFLEPGHMIYTKQEGSQDNIIAFVALEDHTPSGSESGRELKRGDIVLTYVTADQKPYLELFLRKLEQPTNEIK